jgi:hypothetical protein
MPKVVINACYGGFSLNNDVLKRLKRMGVKTDASGGGLSRHDSRLVQAVEESNRENMRTDYLFKGILTTRLEVVEIDSSRYIIREYDGFEEVVTPDKIPWIEVK